MVDVKVYREQGFETRKDYLKSLAEDYGVPLSMVLAAASLLGPNEDFDGLVTEIQDYAMGQDYEEVYPSFEELGCFEPIGW